MAYNFQNRLRHVGGRLSEINSESMVYTRNTDSVVWLASIGRIAEDNPLAAVVPSAVLQRLYVVTGYASQLLINGVVTLPVVNDMIQRSRTGQRFRVIVPEELQAPYKFSTTEEDRIQVFVQKVPKAGLVQL